MSSSYGALNQKYNTLLALVLEGGSGGSGGSQNLQSVLSNGPTTTLSASFNSVGVSPNTVNIGGLGINMGDAGLATTLINSTTASGIIEIGKANTDKVDIKDGLLVAETDILLGTDHVKVDKCWFASGIGGQATMDTQTAIPLYIAPPTSIESEAICSELNLGNTSIPVNISGNNVDINCSGALTVGDDATSITIGTTVAGQIPTISIQTQSTLNTNATPAIAIGTTDSVKTIKIGSNAVTNSVHLASLDITSNSLDNVVNVSGAINIAGRQVSGALGLGNNTGRTADVNIATGGGSGKVNICSTANSLVVGGSQINYQNLSVQDALVTPTKSLALKADTNTQLLVDGSAGASNAVLTSGGASGSLSWIVPTPTVSYASGQILVPSATTVQTQAFGTTFTSIAEPKVYLTYDGGTGATTIVIVGLAGMDGVAGAWTGFKYLTSTAGVAGSKLNWLATN